jgi:amino acid transporter
LLKSAHTQGLNASLPEEAFKQIDADTLEATEEADAPVSGFEHLLYSCKHFMLGKPIATDQESQEKLPKFKALAVLSSDAISSVAYATEAILFSLSAAGSSVLGFALPLALAIVTLLTIVALSYRQTIIAYPNGGGSYIVAKQNISALAGLVAAASLLIDYVLTVSVSIAAGVDNLASLFPTLTSHVVVIDVALVLLVTVINLRGVRDSGTIFALPTYVFIGSALLLIMIGCVKLFVLHYQPAIGAFVPIQAQEPLSIFLLLKSFAAGCSAMTGVEAISNGVPAFRKPEAKNARTTLTWMAVILGTLFLGITVLATSYHIEANVASNPTVISQIAIQVFDGPLTFLYPIFQIATLAILTLAANTSYADFPRLSSLLARDDYLPHQFAFRGDRLAFSTGIICLAILASTLLIAFQGDVSHLIDLYAVGVFMSFTLSQSGMVMHWWRMRSSDKSWRRKLSINGLGAVTTLLVAVVIASTKFFEGAWIVVLLIPLLVSMFLGIHHHYLRVERERTTNIPVHPEEIHHRLIVPIAALDKVSIQSLAYARSVSPNVTAVHIAMDANDVEIIRSGWDALKKKLQATEETQLIVIDSPYRSLNRPLLSYIDRMREQYPQDTITIVLPEFVVGHWWEYFLHNDTALRLKAALLFRPGLVVTNVSQHLMREKL